MTGISNKNSSLPEIKRIKIPDFGPLALSLELLLKTTVTTNFPAAEGVKQGVITRLNPQDRVAELLHG